MSTISSPSKTEIVEFVRTYHSTHGKVPSISSVVKQFGLNKSRFYKLFSGISELCSLAQVPIPERRIQSVSQALVSRSSAREQREVQQSPIQCLALSPALTKRVYGVSQLEGGLDPSQVLEKLLNQDTENRRLQLSLPRTKRVSDFLDLAVSRGWKPELLVAYLTDAWNAGLINLSEETLQNATDSGAVFDPRAVRREQQTSESNGPSQNAIVPDWKVTRWYDYSKENGYTGGMGAFISECVEEFFARRNLFLRTFTQL
jgi:hypothetical protein